MDKYLKMFKPAMTKWLRDHYPLGSKKALEEDGMSG